MNCVKCRSPLEGDLAIGVLSVVITSDLTGKGQSMLVCGECSTEVLEFFTPELLLDPFYMATKAIMESLRRHE